jgi:uncharacterized membrane protein YcaP (DUF421 family)
MYVMAVRWMAVVSFCQFVIFGLLGAWVRDPMTRDSLNKTTGLVLVIHLISLTLLGAHWIATKKSNK